MTPPALPPPATAGEAAPFRLTRHFSWVSLVGVVLVTLGLNLVFRDLTVQHLVDHERRAHADLARAFVNSEWEHATEVLALARREGAKALPGSAPVRVLHHEVLAKMRGLSVVKVKLYDPAGLTIFSTDARQIGEDKSANVGLQAALRGEASSQVTHRQRFDAFEGVINERDLIATYVPVRLDPTGAVQGVMELYSDVTELLDHQQHARWQVAGLALALLTGLYLFLLVVVRRADRILRRQEAERAQREAQIQHMAYHDMLTGLPNRSSFSEQLGQLTAQAAGDRRAGRRGALLFIDLDGFKAVNDRLGHEAGDRYLQEVARRLQAGLRGQDRVFRLGGDEFTVLMHDIGSPQDAALLVERLRQALAEPILLHGQQLSPGASFGIAVCPDDGTDPEALQRHADLAMYGAKALGRRLPRVDPGAAGDVGDAAVATSAAPAREPAPAAP